MAASKQVKCERCYTEFVAVLLGSGEAASKVDVGVSPMLTVVEAEPELGGAVTCPNPDCEEVFLVPEFVVARLKNAVPGP